jgi:hypothetical protein
MKLDDVENLPFNESVATSNASSSLPIEIPNAGIENRIKSKVSETSGGGAESGSQSKFGSSKPQPIQSSSLGSSYSNLASDSFSLDPSAIDLRKDSFSQSHRYSQISDNPNSLASPFARTLRETPDGEREGHLHPLDDLKLLRTDEILYIPSIQDSGFVTEDMLKQQQEVFEKLGTSAEAANIRAKMQSAHLKSGKYIAALIC